MYDSTDPDSIPGDIPLPDYAMGYVDGDWPSYDAMVARFPPSRPVAISAIPGSSAAGRAQGCDGEAGDYSPAQAAHFCALKLVLGVVPFAYCSFAAWHDYQVACSVIGVNPNDVDWGIAAYPGIGPIVYPGAAFHQFADQGTYDQSVVIPGWIPGRLSRPPQNPTEEVTMSVSRAVSFKPGQTDVFQASFGMIWHKFLTLGGWNNEPLTGEFAVVEATRGITVPDQELGVAILGNNQQCAVTFEDSTGRAWFMAQDVGGTSWAVNELP